LRQHYLGFNDLLNHMKTIVLCSLALTLATGCKKAQPTETAPAPENASTPAANPNSPQPQNQAQSQAPAAPPVDTTKAFADVNAAVKAKDYQKAADTLIAVQRQTALTDQQAAAVRAQMVQLQGSVAAGLANGDPNAKAAADRLRAAASGN
jgi:hypothetical protein